jgi:RimJ/RimL family protein N-acetyltransferase
MLSKPLVMGHPVTRLAIEHIVANLRARDRAEIFALRWDDDDTRLVDTIMVSAGALWTVWTYRDEPIAVTGATPLRPGVAAAVAFGTDQWHRALLSMTRHAWKFILPALISIETHRAEAFVLADNTDARRWIESVGGEQEAVLHGYGRAGEDFILYAWRLNDVFRGRGRRRWPAIHALHQERRDAGLRRARAATGGD